MTICIFEHFQWRWALNERLARGYENQQQVLAGHGLLEMFLLRLGSRVSVEVRAGKLHVNQALERSNVRLLT